MALLAPVQAFFGAPALGAARFVAVAIGLGGVGATWWLGRRAYGTGAAIVGAAAVAVATTHVAYSRMAVTDVLLTLAITCVLALAVEGRLEWAGLAVGLAASAKYPGAIAAVPVLVAGWGRWRALGRAAALAVGRVRADEPVRADPRGRRLGRHLARAAARTRGLARLRERPRDPVRVPRPPLGRARPVPPRRGGRPRGRAPAAHPRPISSSSPSRSPTGSR